MKTDFIDSWKFLAILCCLVFFIATGLAYLTQQIVSEVETVGLKTIVESIWYGKAK